jgi:hypothetical protein
MLNRILAQGGGRLLRESCVASGALPFDGCLHIRLIRLASFVNGIAHFFFTIATVAPPRHVILDFFPFHLPDLGIMAMARVRLGVRLAALGGGGHSTIPMCCGCFT